MMADVDNNQDVLDIRDVIGRFEELEAERDEWPMEGEEEVEEPANDIERPDGTTPRRAAWASENPDEAEEFKQLKELLEELCGSGGDHRWKGDWYPLTLIRDSYFVEAMQELVEDIGDLPKNYPAYLKIDWEATAENLRVDYSSVEFGGVTYWYR